MNEAETLRHLQVLEGDWFGSGRGGYPTIARFEYREQLRFVRDAVRPLLHYEQFARHRFEDQQAEQPSHWESGFVRALDGGVVEISNAQDGGRVEVLRGLVRAGAATLQIDLESVFLGHDARLVRTRRQFIAGGDRLRYQVWMHTTRAADLVVHLEADLVRLPGGFAGSGVSF